VKRQRQEDLSQQEDLRTAIEHAVARVVALFSAFVFFCVLALQGWNAWRSALEQVERDALVAAMSLEETFEHWQGALRAAAWDLDRKACDADDWACLSAELDRLVRWEPALATALLTNAEGLVVAAAAAQGLGLASPLALRDADVSDREYFREPRRSGAFFVSPVFKGRGFGEDRIVALSIPVYEKGGRFRGVLQASVTARNFELWVNTVRGKSASSGLSLDLVDAFGQSLLPSPSPAADGRGGNADVRTPLWVASATRATPEGFKVTLRSSPQQWMQSLLPVAVFVLAAAVALLLFLKRAVRALSGRLTVPLEQLVRLVQRVENGELDAIGEVATQPDSWREASEIHHALQMLLTRTRTAMREAREANAALARSNAELAVSIDERDGYIDRQTRRLQEALSAAWKSAETRAQLIANTSHEIRTPLNGILGATELLLRSEPLNASQRQLLRVQLGAARGLLTLVNDILDISRLSRGVLLESKPFDVRQECEFVCDSLRPLANERGLYLTLTADSDFYTFRRGDQSRFRQLALGLVGNALKFTEHGGVSLVLGETPGCELLVEVRDTGPGIPVPKFDAIFEPYVQLDASMTRRRGGAGLGLAIAKDIVSAMEGRIEVESELGKGAVFRVLLPLDIAQPEDIEIDQPSVEVDVAELRVLIVDDIDMNRDLLELQLSAFGCKGQKAAGGTEALAMLEAQAFDLVLLDCQMPKMDGYEVARTIRRLWPDRFLRIVAVTAHAQPGERERCLEAGMDDYVAKPLAMSTLARVLKEANLIASQVAAIGLPALGDREPGR